MGANNSTCLPCKAAGASGRRNKATTGVPNPKDSDKQAQVLKKVSTVAEPQAGNGTASQPSIPEGSQTNGALRSSHSLQGRAQTLQPQPAPHSQGQAGPSFQPTDSPRSQQVVTEKERDVHPELEGIEALEHDAPSSSHQSHPNEVSPAPQTRRLEVVEGQRTNEGVLQHQTHLHVPSHMLAAETETAWQQHHDAQQALLSPHSCSVAHRVAAALRAAAGERAAAAAARAAEAVEAAKMTPKESLEQKALENLRSSSTAGVSVFRTLRAASNGTEDSSQEQQASQQHGAQRASLQNSCFRHVSCFSSSDDSGNEITVRQGLEQRQEGTGSAAPSEHFVVGAAKRMGEMLSRAAAAAAALASPVAEEASDVGEDAAIVPNDQLDSGLSDRRALRQKSSDKGGELSESAAVLLGAMDRAMDTITSDDFKKQASRCLSPECPSLGR